MLRKFKTEAISPSIVVIYQILIEIISGQDTTSVYTSLKKQLTDAISSGVFTTTLKAAAVTFNLPELANVDASTAAQFSALKITIIDQVSLSPSSQPAASSIISTESKRAFSIAAIIGIVIGIVLIIAAVIFLFYYIRRRKQVPFESIDEPNIADRRFYSSGVLDGEVTESINLFLKGNRGSINNSNFNENE